MRALDGLGAAALVAERIAALPRGAEPPLIGLNGAQGSGKSTLGGLIVEALERDHSLRAALLSLDDFYRTKAERERLAEEVHPLCRTRGVPGTHNVSRLETTLAGLALGDEVSIPRFDKLADDRAPHDQWPVWSGRPDVVLLEGWCVGLLSEDVPAWSGPLNALEAECDPDGAWFAWSLAELEQDYDPLWRSFALLVSIEVPGWETVIESRVRQEKGLAAASGRQGMDRQQVIRFIEHYERYTRALWTAMPTRADMLLRRDEKFGYSFGPGGAI
jgi:D-glycerate 3-kinase